MPEAQSLNLEGEFCARSEFPRVACASPLRSRPAPHLGLNFPKPFPGAIRVSWRVGTVCCVCGGWCHPSLSSVACTGAAVPMATRLSWAAEA